MSLAHICMGLNADRIPIMRPERARAGWVSATVMGILTNPVYLGRAAYGRRAGKGKEPVRDPDQWLYSAVPAIVNQEQWDAAHAAMARRRITRSA